MKFLSKKKFNGHVVPSPKYGMCCSNFEGALLGQKLPVFAMKKWQIRGNLLNMTRINLDQKIEF